MEGFEGKYENAKLNLWRQAWLDVGRCFLNILASSSQMPSQSLYCQLKVNRKTAKYLGTELNGVGLCKEALFSISWDCTVYWAVLCKQKFIHKKLPVYLKDFLQL